MDRFCGYWKFNKYNRIIKINSKTCTDRRYERKVWATFAKTLWLQNGITEHKNFRSLSRGYSQCSGSQPEPTTDANNLMGIILTTMVHLVYSSLLSVLLCDVERVPNVVLDGIEDILIRNWHD